MGHPDTMAALERAAAQGCLCGKPSAVGMHSLLSCSAPKHLFDLLEPGTELRVSMTGGAYLDGVFISATGSMAIIRSADHRPVGGDVVEVEVRLAVSQVREVVVFPKGAP